MESVEQQFPIHQFAYDALLSAFSGAAALVDAAASLRSQAAAMQNRAAQPVIQMLGIAEGTPVRVDVIDGVPTLTVRVPALPSAEPHPSTLNPAPVEVES